ncbi:MAG: DEAD/DEAH box helicase, partial [Gammaproteobacteria bacterium]
MTTMPAQVVTQLIKAPLIAAHEIATVHQNLKQLLPGQLPNPILYIQKQLTNIKPIPHLHLKVEKITNSYYLAAPTTLLSCVALHFDYAGVTVPFGDDKPLTHIQGQIINTINRHTAEEKKAYRKLESAGLTRFNLSSSGKTSDLLDCESPEHWKFFILTVLPDLQQAGWQVTIDPDFPYHYVEIKDNDWYSDIDETSDNQWFDLELGIMLDGERINLPPLLLTAIRQLPKEFTTQDIALAVGPINIPLPDGRILLLPIQRVKPILQVLTELYDINTELDAGKLRLSVLRSMQLAELTEAASNIAKFRWLGGEHVLKIGERLRNFSGIVASPPPSEFNATLRPYQQEGLNWLQFLREYELAGILADDMGLGKTVQTLAHLLLEKQSGRMQQPSLVIAPTSLMFNWRMEAEKFAPDLRVLTLHGKERKENFSQAQNYDLILTTYPLVVRDEKYLLSQNYYLLILDEAQIIKNPKAKVTQIVQCLNTKHRLCLTGTPMENHLGELWSLFHFLLPGLLGEAKQFQRLFRTPIEKHQDADRRSSLARRVAPFMLRRTKQQVITELPEKIEVIRTLELSTTQCDLYESIRLAMHAKVTDAIKKKGAARSQIIILDALLKLRQICCDPRLLKIESAKKLAVHSAKLDALMELLPTLLEEGRQILLFSQFTEMLGLIEQRIHEMNIPYVILTGNTVDREQPIRQFQNGEVKLFLISLKAGGVGLNLTAADTVIHYDPW